MNPAVTISCASVLAMLLIAFIGAVWRLGSRVGELKVLTDHAGATLKDVVDAIREIDQRIEKQERQLALHAEQWKVAHRTAEKVIELDKRLGKIEAVCYERVSRRIHAPDQPNAVEDGGIVEAVGCPIEEDT